MSLAQGSFVSGLHMYETELPNIGTLKNMPLSKLPSPTLAGRFLASLADTN